MTDFSWTAEHIAQLTRLWADGDSCGQIAAAMGCSRNAVIGKVHRLGLSGRLRAASQKPRHRAPKRPYARAYPAIRYREAPPAMLQPVYTEAPENPCSLLNLDNTRCHWPVGDPRDSDFHFCGGAVGIGLYCGFHHGIAHQAPASRRTPLRSAA